MYLIGEAIEAFQGDQLPTNIEVLKRLYHISKTKSVKIAAQILLGELESLWKAADICTKSAYNSVKKIIKLRERYRAVQKNKSCNAKYDSFMSNLYCLFDIAHESALEKSPEAAGNFLIDQRRDRRLYLRRQEIDEAECPVPEPSLSTNHEQMENATNDTDVEMESAAETESLFEVDGGRNYVKKMERGVVSIMTEKVVSTLDSCNVSYRDSVRIVGAVAEALEYDANDLIINKSSYNRDRKKIRKDVFVKTKQKFTEKKIENAIVYFDGKLMEDGMSSKTVDRLPVILRAGNEEQLLGAPALPDSKGPTQANAIFNTLQDWGVEKVIRAVCCDTTPANLGFKNGAVVCLERLMDTDFLWLPCRHHIFELTLGSCYEIKLPGTVGPNVMLFKRFRGSWDSINKNNYKSGVEGRSLPINLRTRVGEMIEMVNNFLKITQPRDDYKELLLLAKIFLGATPSSENLTFNKPGAFHHARWMAKAIYSLKIYIFRGEFKLTPFELNKLYDVCLYIVFVHVRFWYTATIAAYCPYDDLNFIKEVCAYEAVDAEIANTVLHKFMNHLWYLSPYIVAISIFDDRIPIELKKRIVIKLKDGPNDDDGYEPNKRHVVNNIDEIKSLASKDLTYFINGNGMDFFKRFALPVTFLDEEIESWPSNLEYCNGREFVKNMQVVNDVAERAISMIEKFAEVKATMEEDQFQYLLQEVSEYRKEYPNATKACILKTF